MDIICHLHKFFKVPVALDNLQGGMFDTSVTSQNIIMLCAPYSPAVDSRLANADHVVSKILIKYVERSSFKSSDGYVVYLLFVPNLETLFTGAGSVCANLSRSVRL